MKAVVLTGGKGTRLGLKDIPKVMVLIDGIPLLERTLRAAVCDGVTDFVFLNGHFSEVIEKHFGDGSKFGATIRHIVETEPLGTAGSFNQIRELLVDPFFVIYGDVLMDVDFRAFSEFALRRGGVGTLFVHPNDHPYDSDLLETDADNRILVFHPKPHEAAAHYPNLVSAALYFLTPKALNFVPPAGASDWGCDVLGHLVEAQSLFAYRSCEYIKDVGTPDRRARAERHLREGRVARLSRRLSKPAVFLDRDGVINEELDGIYSPNQVKLLPGAASAIRAFNEAGVPVICITNQPGLAKGFMDWKDLRAIGGEVDYHLIEEAAAYLDDIFVCPHHPEGGWPGEVKSLKIQCECRKPRDGMLREAAETHNIDLSRSWMVGDRYCDIAAARSAGLRSVLVKSGHGGNDKDKFEVVPDQYCADLAHAAEHILRDLAC